MGRNLGAINHLLRPDVVSDKENYTALKLRNSSTPHRNSWILFIIDFRTTEERLNETTRVNDDLL